MAKQDNTKWIILAVLIGVIFFGRSQGWFSSSGVPELENQNLSYSVSLSITPNEVCSGSSSTGNINSNIPNAECKIYMKTSLTPWILSDTVTLNSNGVYMKSKQADVVGTFYAYASCCDSKSSCKNSNEEILKVTNCSQQVQEQATCTDSDGGQDDQHLIKGTVTSGSNSYTDECNWGTGNLNEYYCDGSSIKMMQWTCTDYWTCQEGKCAQQLCEDIMNPTMEKCASGYTTDGGICSFWSINGNAQCLSSFNTD